MNDEYDIKEAREIINEATTAEWMEGVAGDCNVVSFAGDDIVGVATVVSPRNIKFICAARSSWPAALTALEQANATKDEHYRDLQVAIKRNREMHAVLEANRAQLRLLEAQVSAFQTLITMQKS